MSLVSSEGEGEQNEIRILQEKLGSTMKLVSHLTAQLNELKEQVCPPSPGPHHSTMQGRSHQVQLWGFPPVLLSVAVRWGRQGCAVVGTSSHWVHGPSWTC